MALVGWLFLNYLKPRVCNYVNIKFPVDSVSFSPYMSVILDVVAVVRHPTGLLFAGVARQNCATHEYLLDLNA